MYKFILSTDSTCDLYADFVRDNDIKFVSLNYVVEKDGQFTEGVDAFTEYSQYVDFYRQLREGAFSRTSMLSSWRRRVQKTFCISRSPAGFLPR